MKKKVNGFYVINESYEISYEIQQDTKASPQLSQFISINNIILFYSKSRGSRNYKWKWKTKKIYKITKITVFNTMMYFSICHELNISQEGSVCVFSLRVTIKYIDHQTISWYSYGYRLYDTCYGKLFCCSKNLKSGCSTGTVMYTCNVLW